MKRSAAMPTNPTGSKRFVFPRWANYLLPLIVLGGAGGALYVPVLVWAGLSPDSLWRGYQPAQPIPFSHALHAGELGMDCRYCHSTVEDQRFAAVPDTDTCLDCHNMSDQVAVGIRPESPNLAALRRAYETGEPIEWRKVHQMPDHVYFNHAAHVGAGVSCMKCHGRVDRMEEVYMAQNMSMAWCLECHQSPENHLRPVEYVTDFSWDPRQHLVDHAEEFGVGEEDRERAMAALTHGHNSVRGPVMSREEAQRMIGRRLVDRYGIHDEPYMMSCSTCHW